jgi:hypothetical protein
MPEHRPAEQGQLPTEIDTPNQNPSDNYETPDESSGDMQTVEPNEGPEGGEVATASWRPPGGSHGDEVGNLTIKESAPQQDRDQEPKDQFFGAGTLSGVFLLQGQDGHSAGQTRGEKESGLPSDAAEVEEFLGAWATRERHCGGEYSEKHPEGHQIAHHENPEPEDGCLSLEVVVAVLFAQIQARVK